MNRRLTVNDIPLAVHATCDGIGLTCEREPFAREALADGRLESVLDDWLPPFEGFYSYGPGHFQAAPKRRVFIDFLREWQAMESAPASRRRAARTKPAQR